jgi:hypothetical protein
MRFRAIPLNIILIERSKVPHVFTPRCRGFIDLFLVQGLITVSNLPKQTPRDKRKKNTLLVFYSFKFVKSLDSMVAQSTVDGIYILVSAENIRQALPAEVASEVLQPPREILSHSHKDRFIDVTQIFVEVPEDT